MPLRLLVAIAILIAAFLVLFVVLIASEAAVTQALDDLMRLDLVCRLPVCDLIFYQLNRAPEALRLLDQLFAWQADWQSQLQKLSSYPAE